MQSAGCRRSTNELQPAGDSTHIGPERGYLPRVLSAADGWQTVLLRKPENSLGVIAASLLWRLTGAAISSRLSGSRLAR